jgi:hypothetical protein
MTEAATQPWATIRDQLAASYDEAKGRTGETLEEFQRRGWCAAAAALTHRPIALSNNQPTAAHLQFFPSRRANWIQARSYSGSTWKDIASSVDDYWKAAKGKSAEGYAALMDAAWDAYLRARAAAGAAWADVEPAAREYYKAAEKVRSRRFECSWFCMASSFILLCSRVYQIFATLTATPLPFPRAEGQGQERDGRRIPPPRARDLRGAAARLVRGRLALGRLLVGRGQVPREGGAPHEHSTRAGSLCISAIRFFFFFFFLR